MTEQWAEIFGFPKYRVSNYGRVKRDDREHPVGVHVNQQGIAYVSLMNGTEQVHRALARLVAKAFLTQKNDAFDTPINLDGDRLHCHADNLEWRPRWFAIQYHMQFNNRWHNPIESPLRDMDTGEVYDNSWTVVTTFGLLEKDVVLSVDHYTVCWPTFKRFQYAD
jgi:hypothetical protein